MPVEALLKDQAWLRGLARRLVRDEASADDLVQEGWLRALRSPPTRHVRSWWRSVLVRRAIDLRREESRRRAREERVPAPAAPPDDLLERVEMQEAVARAVKGLAEPYRRVVLLRYFEGLPPRTIAKRLGAPVETVRTHLKRAHALLRERLDAERRDWKGAMLLLAWPGSIPKLLGGMVAMAHTKKLSIVAVVLLVLPLSLLLTWRGLGGTEPPPRATETALAHAPAAPPADPSSTPEAVEGWSIGIRTLGPDGTPLPRVEVEASVVVGGKTVDQQTIMTDALGTAAWRLPAFAQTVSLELRASAPGLPDARRELLVATGREAPECIDLRLRPLDGLVAGRVLDSRGEPIAGATVETVHSRTTTGADGRYELPVPADEKEAYVWSHAPGYALERVAASLREGNGRADLQLREEFRIRGTVRDDEGHPVAGAVVRTFFTGWCQYAVSDDDGRYVLAHLDPGRDRQMLMAGHPAYAPFAETVATTGSEADVDIVLCHGVPLAGRVEDPDGEPVPGAGVMVSTLDPVTFGNVETTSDEDGRFAFASRFEPGEQSLRVNHPPFAPFVGNVSLPADKPLVVRLEAPHHVSGTAVDDRGHPIEVHVAARVGDRPVGRRGMSGADGRWRVDRVPAGKVDLHFFGPGCLRVTVEGIDADTEDVAVTVPRAAHFEGRVVDDATGAPVPSFTLRVTSATGSGRPSATWVREGYRFDDPRGRWTIDEEYEPGATAGVEVRADGYAPAHGSATAAIEPDPENCIVRMRKGLTIEGTVLDDATGRPIEGADVRLEPPGAPAYADGETHRRHVQRTDGEGRFRFPAMGPGLVLRIQHPDYAPFLKRDVGAEPLTVRLHAGCVVEGTASPGDEVTLVGDDKSRDMIADDTGRFRFERLPEGKYHLAKRVRLEKPPVTWFAYPVVRPVEVTRARPVDVELKSPGTATVRATVGGTKDVEGSVVYLSREGDRMPLSTFVHDRRFELTGIEPGHYRLTVQPGDPRRTGTEIEIREGETREITLGTGD